MPYLKVTSKGMYLVEERISDHIKGETIDYYIDKVTFESKDNKLFITKFPSGWFKDKEIEIGITPRVVNAIHDDLDNKSFKQIQLLKTLEIPISSDSYTSLKKSKDIKELIKNYFDKIIGNLSDEFYQYKYVESNSSDNVYLIKSYNGYTILRRFRYSTPNSNSEQEKTLEFPNWDFGDNDFTDASPSFSSILLFASWKAGLTIRPDVKVDKHNQTLEVNLRFEKSKIIETTKEPTIAILEKSLRPQNLSIPKQKLETTINQIEKLWGINIIATENLLSKVLPKINTLGKVNFCTVMDQIVILLNDDSVDSQVVWDWEGNSVRIDTV